MTSSIRNYKNFIYNEERGFIFAYVPKVACTNWKSLLRYMAGYDNWLDNKLAHDKVNGGLRYLDLEGPDAELLRDPSIRKYTMVRDPYSRILSAYLNKIESNLPIEPETPGEDHYRKVVRAVDSYRQEVLGSDQFPEINFEMFLRWIINEAGVRDGKEYMRADEHWAPQCVLLRQPETKFDVIGRFENITKDASRLLAMMDCNQQFPTQKDVNFAPTSAKSKLDRYYNESARSIVNELFRCDFVELGYEFWKNAN